ncbi:pre-peptidase C-terminal domain-containing protein [Planctomycetota bacterium]
MVIPAGALTQDTTISISLADNPHGSDEVATFAFSSEGQPFTQDVLLTLKYTDQFLADFGITDETQLIILSIDESTGNAEWVPTISQDEPENLVSCDTPHFSWWGVTIPALYRGWNNVSGFIDPSIPAEIKDTVFGGEIIVPSDGDTTLSIGKGSLEGIGGFWESDASENVIVIHGVISDALAFNGVNDVVKGLQPYYSNVVVFQYRSLKSIESNGNLLYDLIKQNKQGGFGTSIVAHSMGGLVARYAMEQAHNDTNRPGYAPGDPSLASDIGKLVTLSTPHEGAPAANIVTCCVGNGLNIYTDVLYWAGFQGLYDLETGSSGFTGQLNSVYINNATEYYKIVGDADAVVSLTSGATGYPSLISPEANRIFAGEGHSTIHVDAATNGVLDQCVIWLSEGLSSDVSAGGIVALDQWHCYSIEVPLGATELVVETTNATSDVDLYVRKGLLPSLSDYDFRPYTASGNEIVTVDVSSSPPISPGIWYIGVYGYEAGSYTVKATITTANTVQQIACGVFHTIGLKSDGTAVAAGLNSSGQCDVSGWTDIVQVAGGTAHTIGLKSDGTVVAVGVNVGLVSGWTGIVQVASGSGDHAIGLKSDGTAVAVGINSDGQCDVSGWSGIVQVAGGSNHTIGLKSDGTAVAAGLNGSGQCDVSGWTDIVQVAGGSNHTIGLKSDGTAVAVGINSDGQCDVSGWTDIVQVAGGLEHTIGLKSDGTVVAVGYNVDGQCDVSGWTDIAQVAGGLEHTIGLKSDGTAVAVGGNSFGACDVSGW